MDRSSTHHSVEYHGVVSEWSECYSRTGKKYYYNSRTANSQWEIPPEFLTYRRYKERARVVEPLTQEQLIPPKKYKGAGLLLTPTLKQNGIENYGLRPSVPIVPSPTTPLSTPSRVRILNHTPRPRPLEVTPVRPSTSKRQSLSNLTIRQQEDYASLHEAIPSPVINREHKLSNNRNSSSPPRGHNDTPSGSGRLAKLLNSSLDTPPDYSELNYSAKQELIRTKYLDLQSISLLTNQSAEIVERQGKQLHEDARRLLDVDLMRTITECANLRAVQNVHSLRSLNIEHKLELLRDHIRWLEDGSDFT